MGELDIIEARAEVRRLLQSEATEENIDRLQESLIRLDQHRYDYGKRLDQLERKVCDLKAALFLVGSFTAVFVLERIFGAERVKEWALPGVAAWFALGAIRWAYLRIKRPTT